MRIPAALQREWSHDPDWLAELPRLVHECAEQWGLDIEEPVGTPRSLVVPAGEFVLKLNAPSHFEADHEATALECWAGNGAVRLVALDDGRRAFLMERCRPGTALADLGVDPTVVLADLLPRLWVEPASDHPFRLIADEAERWAADVNSAYERAGRPFERSLVLAALDVFRTCDRRAVTLVNQDLHGGNVLAAEREPFLVIDPKPAIGEREVSGVGLLRNAARKGGAREVRRWLAALAELGLDVDLLRSWGVAHALAWGRDREGRWSPSAVEAARAAAAA
ncbi:MAG TPA: aminoglycoside phosphotransferase family protein [Gaiella sp.]|nr:aminoglycoside phosphotransferase family protein [Gaiella sp.]